MIDIGRPLHAYDIDKIKGKTLRITKSKKTTSFLHSMETLTS